MRYLTKLLFIATILLMPILAYAQGNAVVLSRSGAASGSCPFVLFWNRTDASNLYYCDASTNTYKELLNSSNAAGGSTTQLQYNNAGAFGGISKWETNGTTTLTGIATSLFDISAGNMKPPAAAGFTATATNQFGIDLTAKTLKFWDGTASATAGGSVDVNGSTVTAPNLNATTPAAVANSTNCTWQVSSSSVSCYVSQLLTESIQTSGPVADIGGAQVSYYNNAAGALTFTAPACAAGLIRTYTNATGKSGVITVQLAASNTVDLHGVNSSSAGTLVSGGALGDSVTVECDAANHGYATVRSGAWSTT